MKKQEKWTCPKCNSIAKIVRRYGDKTYRLCNDCNTKYITKYQNEEIVVIHSYTPSKYFKEEN